MKPESIMNSKALAASLCASGAFPTKTAAVAAVAAVFNEIAAGLRAGAAVNLTGFGVFEPVAHGAKRVRHPKTGEIVTVAARHKVKFRAKRALLQA